MPILVYRYGLLPPTAGGDLVSEQISLAHRYQNKLIEIERLSREEREAAFRSDPEVAAIEERIAGVQKELEIERAALSAAHAEARTRDTGDPTRAKNLRATLKDLWPERKRIRKEASERPAVKAALEAVNEKRKELIRQARGECGVYWGTYLPIEAAVEQARKSVTPPRFRPWNGEGSVCVQLMNGLKVGEDLLTDRRLQITDTPIPVPGRKGKPLPRVRLRVGSEGRDPIFAEWPVILHRPLPSDAVLKWAKVVRRRIGAHEQWSLHLTLELPSTEVTASNEPAAIAVNLRWSKQSGDQLTVADWAAASKTGNLLVDQAIESAMRKADDLRSIRDMNFEKAKAALIEWKQTVTLPAEHQERLQHLHAWRACGKLAAFVLWWRGNRFSGDDVGFLNAESWRKQDKHLWDWEANARRKAIARRRDGYRVFSARAVEEHNVLVIEKLNISTLAAKPAPEEERDFNHQASSQRFSAAPSELRSALVNAFKRDGKRVVEVNAGLSSVEMLSAFQKGVGSDVVTKQGPSKRVQNMRNKKKDIPA